MKKIFTIILCCFILFSCKTNDNINQKNLSETEIVESKITAISKDTKNSDLYHLWKLYLLKNSYQQNEEIDDLFKSKFESVLSEIEKNYSNQKWYVVCSSMESVNRIISDMNQKYKTTYNINDKYQQMYKQSVENIKAVYSNNLVKPSNQPIQKISTVIDGTVTIWIDLGVKITEGKAYSNRGIGSGFFIDPRGYLITNYHVISSQVDPEYEGISRLYLKFGNDLETRIPAKVVGYDKSLDLALLKTEVPPSYIFALGSSENLDIGDKIFAIGSPVGLERTLTSGIVSAEGRQLFSIGTVMQIDAAVNNGNSGGPIIDQNGNVQAIVFAGMLQYEGLNFAIPVEYLESILPRLYEGDEVAHSWFGFYGRSNKKDGIEVLWIDRQSPFYSSNIEKGSVIKKINNNVISSMEDLHHEMLIIPPNSVVELDYSFENNEYKQLVYVGKRESQPGLSFYKNNSKSEIFLPFFGMELKNSSSVSKNKFIVNRVIKGSVADESGFSELDPIQVFRTYLSKEEDVVYAEVYSKKKSNGYLDLSLVVAAPLDSENFF